MFESIGHLKVLHDPPIPNHNPEKMKFSKSFKFHPEIWERSEPITADELQNQIEFMFTMKRLPGLFFKLKNPYYGMDCFQFSFDTDNGIYVKDGDMKFNNFMGDEILDSGIDSITFIIDYLIDNQLSFLILNHPDATKE
jgi:hypothetical protein